MAFTPKNWEDSPAVTTPLSAVAIEDLETRVTDYADLRAKGLLPNIKDDYGAGGVGGDDTAEIQAAVDDLPATGGAIWCPEGYYGLSDSIVLPSFVTLLGPGSGSRAIEYGINPSTASASLVALNGMTAPLITNDDTVNGNTAISIIGMRLHAPDDADVAGILFDKVRRGRVVDIYILGAATTSRLGIHVQGGSEITRIRDSFLEGCGIRTDEASAATYIDNCEIGAGGIYFSGAYGSQVTNCQLYNDGTPAGQGYASWPTGIQVYLSNECIVTDNSVNAFSNDGISINSSLRCQVLTNTSINNGRETADTYSGILLYGSGGGQNCDGNLIIGNQCYDRQGSPTQKSGLRMVEGGSNVDTNTVKLNNFNGNVTELITDNGVLGNYVSDNPT